MVAAGIVIALRLGPSGLGPHPPVAATFAGDAARPPFYGNDNAGMSARSFVRIEETRDEPARVLDFYERSVDRATWTVASRGRANIALVLRADPSVRGGVSLESAGNGTRITLFVEDMRLPAGFPEDFPARPRAHAIDAVRVAASLYHVRWDVGAGLGFVTGFAAALEDAGWEVMTKTRGQFDLFSLTCRSRARPDLSCRIAMRNDPTSFIQPTFSIADVWVGVGADRTH